MDIQQGLVRNHCKRFAWIQERFSLFIG